MFRVEGPGVFLKVAGTDRVKDYGKFLPWAKEHGYLVGDDTGGGSGDDLSRCR